MAAQWITLLPSRLAAQGRGSSKSSGIWGTWTMSIVSPCSSLITNALGTKFLPCRMALAKISLAERTATCLASIVSEVLPFLVRHSLGASNQMKSNESRSGAWQTPSCSSLDRDSRPVCLVMDLKFKHSFARSSYVELHSDAPTFSTCSNY